MKTSKSFDLTVCAVVVSFNRIEKLKNALHAIESQVTRVEHMLIIDNGSTDGSREMLSTIVSRNVTVVFPPTNLGGAGGFALGIDLAVSLGDFDYIWLMDDDAAPYNDCLSELLKAAEDLPEVNVLAPQICMHDGLPDTRSFPQLERKFSQQLEYTSVGVIAIRSCSFVGPLIRANAVRMEALPIEHFFIWHDDTEYTNRLNRIRPGAYVPRARILHDVPETDSSARAVARVFWDCRNWIWYLKSASKMALTRSTKARVWIEGLPVLVNKLSRSGYKFNGIRGTLIGLLTAPKSRKSSANLSEALGSSSLLRFDAQQT